ncbi:MAG: hypothetical protein Kow00120_07780 [Anaerolineae bacterium]
MARLSVLVAVQRDQVERYRAHLPKEEGIEVTTVTSEEKVRDILAAPEYAFDVMVIEASLCNVPELLRDVQRDNPALLAILVDEGADFALPGRAHDISTDPFHNDDLLKRIKRLAEERRLETLRADELAPVRSFARHIRKASGGVSKLEAAVIAVGDLGYDYAGYYAVDWSVDPPRLTVVAQRGPARVLHTIPAQQPLDGLLGWVVTNGAARIIGPNDAPGHTLVTDGVFGSAVAVPVGVNLRFGVILACRDGADAISGEDAMMLELVAAQLAAALAAEARERQKS